MTDTVLYRKYRPQSFDEVRGQEHIVSALEGAIKQDNIAHAYLFAGSRGTGKTTIARILAHNLNISDNDIHEIDAASNRGIDDVRELRESVHVLPFASDKKIYIIDEVHMLTKDAFNALLKTLEEPPQHVIFVLATTEYEKVLDTIVSRCQVFHFRKPSQRVLRDAILDVAQKEGLKDLESAAAELIAVLSEGSFRDALGTLQKVKASITKDKITRADVEEVTGAPSSELINTVITAIFEKDIARGVSAIESAQEADVDMRTFLKLILQKMRALLLMRFAPDTKEQFQEQFTEEDMQFLEDMGQKNKGHITSQTLLRLLEASDHMRYAAILSLPIELALIDLVGEEPTA